MAAASPAAVMPMPPAFMRNAHEVVRADLNKVAAPALAVGEVARFKKAFEDLNRFMHTHGIMEDGRGDLPGFFKLLNDHSSGAVTAAGLPDEHVKLDAAADAVTAALAGNGDVAAAFAHYKDVCEAHLKHEEDIMMPIVGTLPNPKAPLVAAHSLPAAEDAGDMEFYVSHGVATLSAHGSTASTPAVCTRVWVHALQAISRPDAWTGRYLPLVRAAAVPDVWAAMVAEVPGLEGPGLLKA